jgi:hypothetical protein
MFYGQIEKNLLEGSTKKPEKNLLEGSTNKPEKSF